MAAQSIREAHPAWREQSEGKSAPPAVWATSSPRHLSPPHGPLQRHDADAPRCGPCRQNRARKGSRLNRPRTLNPTTPARSLRPVWVSPFTDQPPARTRKCRLSPPKRILGKPVQSATLGANECARSVHLRHRAHRPSWEGFLPKHRPLPYRPVRRSLGKGGITHSIPLFSPPCGPAQLALSGASRRKQIPGSQPKQHGTGFRRKGRPKGWKPSS